jgi:hypothetical protein
MSRPDARNLAPNREARLIVATKEAPTRDATAAGTVSLGAARRGGFVGPPRSVKPPFRHRVSKVDKKGRQPLFPTG